jgi:hypothetical protein
MCSGPVPQQPPTARAQWLAQVTASARYSCGVRPLKIKLGGVHRSVSAYTPIGPA